MHGPPSVNWYFVLFCTILIVFMLCYNLMQPANIVYVADTPPLFSRAPAH